MKTRIEYVPPRLEFRLAPLPRWVVLMFAVLTMAILVATVWMYAQENPDALRLPDLPKPPNVTAAMQNRVDAVVRKVTK